GVDKVASQLGSVVDIDLKPKNVQVQFVRAWNSGVHIGGFPGMTEEEINTVSQVIRNVIVTRFLPSNAVLPSTVQHMQFKGLTGALPAVGVLLNAGDDIGDPASLSDVFLGDGDDFAFAASTDFIVAAFSSLTSQLKALNFSVPFSVP